MKKIKTIPLEAGTEEKIDLVGGQHVKIKNLGDTTVYVSKQENVVPEADGVKSVQGGSAEILTDVAVYQSKSHVFDWYGTIYAVSDSDCKLELETTNNANFRQIVKGGEGASTTLDTVLKPGARYQLGILTSDINIRLPESANGDIEVDFAVGANSYNISCEYLSLIPVANTYYQIVFTHDKPLKTWFSSVISNDYNPVSTTAEVLTDEP